MTNEREVPGLDKSPGRFNPYPVFTPSAPLRRVRSPSQT